jgi:GAF domain-containing protein
MAPPTSFEAPRQAAVDSIASIDFEANAFDDLTRRAAEVFGTAFAVISIVDQDTLWFKSRIGIDLTGRPRAQSFCALAIADPGRVMVVEDALLDERVRSFPNVVEAPHLRFYAGVPLIVNDQPVGTLCAFDGVPRKVTPEQIDELRFLADQVMATIESRR